ncbi:MAG: type III pantothenate kinase [Mycoplasmoidaceae bacterium]
MKKNNYLLIDYGNSYVKACLYDKTNDQIVETAQTPKTVNPNDLLSLFDHLSSFKPDVIIESNTAVAEYIQPFNASLSQLFPKAKIKMITRPDFKGLVDLSNISPSVAIGSDLLVSAYYITKTIKIGAVCSLGTVYTCIVSKHKQISSCYFVPSMSKSLKTISSITTIPRDYIPQKYDEIKGMNTPSCFAAGANFAVSGWLNKVVKVNKLTSKQLLLTGGDVCRFPSLKKEYKEVKNLILRGLAMLVKEKQW